MVAELQGNPVASFPGFGLNEYQAGEMKSILDAFIRIHKTAGDTAATQGVFTLLDLCQRATMAVLNEVKSAEEGGLSTNFDWVLAQLRSGMADVATFVEDLVHERPKLLQRFLHKVGVVAENPPPKFQQLEVTLRGILAVLLSLDALPNLSTMSSAPPIPEEHQGSPALPLPWDALELAQSLYDFAAQLGEREVGAFGVLTMFIFRCLIASVRVHPAAFSRGGLSRQTSIPTFLPTDPATTMNSFPLCDFFGTEIWS